MPRRVLDTNILSKHWDACVHRRQRGRAVTEDDAKRWARELIDLQGTRSILTPIAIEYVCRGATAHDVSLARAYLAEFDVADRGRVLPEDWEAAKRVAQRVLPDRRTRQLGDCLIRAICDRLNLDVFTGDKRFPKRKSADAGGGGG